MASSKLLYSLLLLQVLLSSSPLSTHSALFAEYIGAQGNGVHFLDVPIHPDVEFHFILSFAIDYNTSGSSPTPTNGQFDVFWDNNTLSPSQISAIKNSHSNVKVALSIGGASVRGTPVNFQPSSITSWVYNAVSSLTKIIKEYNLDGIDIDYEQFKTDDETFAECIGQLITTLKQNGTISFVSIAPFADDQVQSHYLALWKNYGNLIDYVNFQFYAYDNSTTVLQFLNYFEIQNFNYNGSKMLASVASDGISGGLKPADGFFDACSTLHRQGKLQGIFIWCADESKKDSFRLESQSQNLLASVAVSPSSPNNPCEQGCSGAGRAHRIFGGIFYFYFPIFILTVIYFWDRLMENVHS